MPKFNWGRHPVQKKHKYIIQKKLYIKNVNLKIRVATLNGFKEKPRTKRVFEIG